MKLVNSKSENEAREQSILNAAVRLILRQGYDKTSMSDIADEAAVSRGIIYLHFESKEALFKALIETEIWEYAQLWFKHIEENPRGGTVGGIYRAVLYAIRQRPLMSAIIKRDKRIFGNYLHRADNLFASMQASSFGADLLRQLQAAGTVRADVDTHVFSHLMDLMSYGLLNADELSPTENQPPLELIMETMAEMLDKMLTPEDGGNLEAGKAVMHQFAATAAQALQTAKTNTESQSS
jgi:AcrR family transcriptional regulator